MQLVYPVFAVMVCSMYVVHDTQLVIGQSLFTCKNHNISFGIDEYIFAALNLYVDIIGLCLQFLELFGKKK